MGVRLRHPLPEGGTRPAGFGFIPPQKSPESGNKAEIQPPAFASCADERRALPNPPNRVRSNDPSTHESLPPPASRNPRAHRSHGEPGACTHNGKMTPREPTAMTPDVGVRNQRQHKLAPDPGAIIRTATSDKGPRIQNMRTGRPTRRAVVGVRVLPGGCRARRSTAGGSSAAGISGSGKQGC